MSELNSVRDAINNRLAVQRVVFWHDPSGEYDADVDALELGAVNVIRLQGNEFGVKSTILADHVTKHLVYRTGETPRGTGNWLLDLELAYGVFTADKTSMLQQEFGLNEPALAAVIEQHQNFFGANSRKLALAKLLAPGDDAAKMQAKMSQVLVKSSGHTLTDIIRELLAENAANKRAKLDDLATFGLDQFLWGGLAKIYKYSATNPTIDDFVLWMYSRAIEDFASETPGEFRNIRNDFNSLRYDVRTQAMMATLASRAAEALDLKSRIEHRDFRELVPVTTFEEIDRKIIVDLAAAVAAQAVTPREVAETVRQRQDSLWKDKYTKLYEATQSASELLAAIAALPNTIPSMDAGLQKYQSDWFRIDQQYRWFTSAYQTAEFQKPLEALKAEVDKQYANKFLHGFGGLWQQALEPTDQWKSISLAPQSKFFDNHVAPIVKDGRTKAVVIISDGMRYEVAHELTSLIRSEDRFDGSLSAVLGMLPSYTQLGMAALLPQSALELDPEALPVLADGKPTNGTANRDKILQAVKGHAISAADVLAMPGDELRELYKQHQIFYVYHDRIDAAGDKAATERTVFQAAEDTLRELLLLVKKWTNANATNILITADHGFLYQDTPLEQAYYVSEAPQGEAITKTNRRYVLGRSLKPSPSFMTFTSAQAGLVGDIDIQIPKSIHRIPHPGAGTRYVHGGASLQEIVVPVIAVNKKRRSDIRPVEVDLMPETDKITTGQLSVKLLQREAVTDKIQPRQVRLGIYAGEKPISDQPVLAFDSSSADQRDRYQSVTLYLTQDADDVNNRAVELRLEDRIPNTNQWKTFSKANYTIKRSFMTDFDF
ncbi:BREX-1 system phosphatase PglZ type A [Mycobacteroides abscessus]|uniref:BREX-1 system phosphatase PglZ type A n=1 Tax=Mycobacteroides abscessus TaxID=36809 RepID=UPI00092A3AD7|nr:BREX-1 system phosphatase PglZ type A [Mycobacteroides abscessus]MBN7457196.1 BREX-1 system phosphatase PglZ type A [Mycobacteroides abscessus subsp. abscessus]MBN7546824.1 BREX-1 system phosphatase PglZ type A [Mycobacteroides abscessus subsp. abscessus]MBN7570171.1 BREX-1 system phosphatase PglZ type A [Mycobacteroides abscessus subsp. abscessus]QSM95014.1 BREX-1 system phosphatase PglZ type A [Mycobacteroides abscessus subsp. abscessus]QSN00050.1 BREX-1 system phosphatase PglZ type A [My